MLLFASANGRQLSWWLILFSIQLVLAIEEAADDEGESTSDGLIGYEAMSGTLRGEILKLYSLLCDTTTLKKIQMGYILEPLDRFERGRDLSKDCRPADMFGLTERIEIALAIRRPGTLKLARAIIKGMTEEKAPACRTKLNQDIKETVRTLDIDKKKDVLILFDSIRKEYGFSSEQALPYPVERSKLIRAFLTYMKTKLSLSVINGIAKICDFRKSYDLLNRNLSTGLLSPIHAVWSGLNFALMFIGEDADYAGIELDEESKQWINYALICREIGTDEEEFKNQLFEERRNLLACKKSNIWNQLFRLKQQQ